jgi:hypothetical protein
MAMIYRTGFLLKRVVFVAAMALLLAACGGGGGGDGGGGGAAPLANTGALSLGITDAPVDDLYAVWVTFTSVIIQPADGSDRIVVDVTDDQGNGKSIELKALGQGKTEMLLDEYPLPAGDYSWVRLVIDPLKTYVVEDEGGAELLLDCPSCTKSGLKLNRPFNMEARGWVAFTIDFDLRKSITLRQRNKPNPQDYDYMLRPTLRILDTEIASAFIHGTVTDVRSEQSNPDTPAGCMVYVYTGDVETDDICMTQDDPPVDCPTDGARPHTEADVALDTDDGFYKYRTGFLYPDLYTLALVCEDDDPLLDEDLLFIGRVTVDAPAAAYGTERNLLLEDTPRLLLSKQIASGNPFSKVGDVVKYDYLVTNTGNDSLAGPVTVADDKTTVACPALITIGDLDASLDPGEKVTCTADYTIIAADVVAGEVINKAVASADGVDSNADVEKAELAVP